MKYLIWSSFGAENASSCSELHPSPVAKWSYWFFILFKRPTTFLFHAFLILLAMYRTRFWKTGRPMDFRARHFHFRRITKKRKFSRAVITRSHAIYEDTVTPNDECHYTTEPELKLHWRNLFCRWFMQENNFDMGFCDGVIFQIHGLVHSVLWVRRNNVWFKTSCPPRSRVAQDRILHVCKNNVSEWKPLKFVAK